MASSGHALPPRLTSVLRVVLANRPQPDVDQEFVSRARSLDKRRRAAGRDGGFTWAAFLRDKPGGAALPKAVLAKQRDRFAEFLHACGAAVGDDDGSQGMAQAAAQVVFKHAAGGRGGSLRAQLGRVESSKQLTRARSLARELLEWQAALQGQPLIFALRNL